MGAARAGGGDRADAFDDALGRVVRRRFRMPRASGGGRSLLGRGTRSLRGDVRIVVRGGLGERACRPTARERERGRSPLPDASTAGATARFEDARWPSAELLNAGFSLPFCYPDRFDDLWRRIHASIRPGGRFCGQLFGERDEWAGEKDMTFFTRDAAEALFGGFELERFDEEDADGETAVGEPKHWHVFHVVAQRIRETETAVA